MTLLLILDPASNRNYKVTTYPMLDSTSFQHLYNDNLFLENIFRINPDKIENEVNSTANCDFFHTLLA